MFSVVIGNTNRYLPRVSKENVMVTIFGFCYDSLKFREFSEMHLGKSLLFVVCAELLQI